MTKLRMIGVAVILVAVVVGLVLPLCGIGWISLGPTESITPLLVQSEVAVDRRVALPLFGVLLLGVVCLAVPRQGLLKSRG